MVLKQVLEIYELLDKPNASGEEVANFFKAKGAKNVETKTIKGDEGSTDFIKIVIEGQNGKLKGGDTPTLGIIGRLGGLGARPEVLGFVSDGDGALAALSTALKLVDMQKKGDCLKGDIIVTTHICPDAPTQDHEPVRFMGSPVDMETMNKVEVVDEMDAILSIDTTKGNEILNYNGFAISPTIKEGYILKVSNDLIDIIKRTTGKMPNVFPVSIQDITPYGNGLYHLNSILQPATSTQAPVVGVAITTETSVAGCATGATNPYTIESTSRFAIEVAKDFSEGKCNFYDKDEFKKIIELYGDNKRFQKKCTN